MTNTKASDLIRLSNDDVMTLGEALDSGRMTVAPNPCQGPRGGVVYTADEVGTSKCFVIGKMLWQSRIDKAALAGTRVG